MSPCHSKPYLDREAILHRSMMPFIGEMIDEEDDSLLRLIASGEFVQVENRVNGLLADSGIFGGIRFAGFLDAEFFWTAAPKIALDFELLTEDVFCYFRVEIEGARKNTSILHISFKSQADPAANTDYLRRLLIS